MDQQEFVYLDYLFMFPPSTTWSSLTEFESSLADFFKAYGYEAEIMKTMEGQYCKRILLIRKIEGIPGGIDNVTQKPVKGEVN